MKASDYFITPGDLWGLFKKLKWRDVFGVVGFGLIWGVLPLLTASIQLQEAFFIAFIFAMFYWRFDARVAIGAGLACLVLIPVLLAALYNTFLFDVGAITETLAIWAFYFLCIGVIKQIFDFVGEKKD